MSRCNGSPVNEPKQCALFELCGNTVYRGQYCRAHYHRKEKFGSFTARKCSRCKQIVDDISSRLLCHRGKWICSECQVNEPVSNRDVMRSATSTEQLLGIAEMRFTEAVSMVRVRILTSSRGNTILTAIRLASEGIMALTEASKKE